MSKERELLRRISSHSESRIPTNFIYEIQELLNQPERGPLSDGEIYDRCCAMDSSYTCNFIDGVEWAEHQHGIRSFDDE